MLRCSKPSPRLTAWACPLEARGRLRDEPSWFSATFAPQRVRSIKDLDFAFGDEWEYDVLYDALSSQIHPRGWSSDLTIDGEGVGVHHPHNPEWFTFENQAAVFDPFVQVHCGLTGSTEDTGIHRRPATPHHVRCRRCTMRAATWRFGVHR